MGVICLKDEEEEFNESEGGESLEEESNDIEVLSKEYSTSGTECKVVDHKIVNIIGHVPHFKTVAELWSIDTQNEICFQTYEILIGNCLTKWTLSMKYKKGFLDNEVYKPIVKCFKEGTDDVFVDVEISVIDSEGNHCFAQKMANNQRLVTYSNFMPKDSFLNGSSWFRTEEFFSKLDSQGNLTISCDLVLKVIIKKTVPIHPMPVVEKKSQNEKYVERMKNMLVYASSYYSDITLVCSDGSIPCHANILATGSSFFQEKLSAGDSKTTEIKMEDLSMERCFILLEFIYTNKIDSNNIDLQILQHSVNYGIYNLREHCSPFLARKIDSDTCLDSLILADKICDVDLKTAAKNYILSNNVDTKKLQTHPHLLYQLLTDRMSSQN